MKPLTHKSRYPSQAVESAELDVTPIMNMFIILIPFLVSMAVFTHLAVLHFSLPPEAGSSLVKNDEKPHPKITVVVAEEYLAITRGEMMLDSIAAINGTYNLKQLSTRLNYHRAVSDLNNEAVVAVRNRIEFRHVVNIMDTCRNAGFSKIGLSNATEDPQKGV